MARKLTDADVAALRRRHSDGLSSVNVAAEFGISARQVQRIVGGAQRATLPPVDDVADADSTVAAVDRYVQPLSLDAAGEVIAAAARALAWKLDQVRGSDASASASAAPALARELAAMLDRLSDAAQRAEPSPLDEILRRRDERLAAMRRENEPR